MVLRIRWLFLLFVFGFSSADDLVTQDTTSNKNQSFCGAGRYYPSSIAAIIDTPLRCTNYTNGLGIYGFDESDRHLLGFFADVEIIWNGSLDIRGNRFHVIHFPNLQNIHTEDADAVVVYNNTELERIYLGSADVDEKRISIVESPKLIMSPHDRQTLKTTTNSELSINFARSEPCDGKTFTEEEIDRDIFDGIVCEHYSGDVTIDGITGSQMSFFSDVISIDGRLTIENNKVPVLNFQKLITIGKNGVSGPGLVVKENKGLRVLTLPSLAKIRSDGSTKILIEHNQGFTMDVDDELLPIGLVVDFAFDIDFLMVPPRALDLPSCPKRLSINVTDKALETHVDEIKTDILNLDVLLYVSAAMTSLLVCALPFVLFWFRLRLIRSWTTEQLMDAMAPLPSLSAAHLRNLFVMVKALLASPIPIIRQFTIYKPPLFEAMAWNSLRINNAADRDNDDLFNISSTDSLTKLLCMPEKIVVHVCFKESFDPLLVKLKHKRNTFPANVIKGEDGGEDSVTLERTTTVELAPSVTGRVFDRKVVGRDGVGWQSAWTLLTFSDFPLNNLVPPSTVSLLATLVLRAEVMFVFDENSLDQLYFVAFLRRVLQVVTTSTGPEIELAQLCPHLNYRLRMTCGNAFYLVSVMQFLLDFLEFSDKKVKAELDDSAWNRLMDHIRMYSEQPDAHTESIVDLSVLRSKLSKQQIAMLSRNPSDLTIKLQMLDHANKSETA